MVPSWAVGVWHLYGGIPLIQDAVRGELSLSISLEGQVSSAHEPDFHNFTYLINQSALTNSFFSL